MENNFKIKIRELEKKDINGLNVLPPVEWNSDYENFLASFLDEEYFKAYVLILEKKIIGTGNIFIKNNIGWLANIIVDKKYKGKGFGYIITKYLTDYLIYKNCETILLLASELGKPVYEKIGFKSITEYKSFETEQSYSLNISSFNIRELNEFDFEQVVNLDFIVNGENRSHLIKKFYNNGLGYFNNKNQLLGFYLQKLGRGLIISKDEDVGITLLNLKHSEKFKRSLVPIENVKAIEFLENKEFKKGYKCIKMYLGKKNKWNPQNIFSYGGGYCG